MTPPEGTRTTSTDHQPTAVILELLEGVALPNWS